MEHITLYFRQGSSDKIYQASIVLQGDGHVVQFSYGRRGSALATGTKTQAPVSYAQAKKIYDQLVAGKIAKGYSPGEDGTPYQQTGHHDRTTGIHCQLLNPIEEDGMERLIADPAWWLQEKHDGRRLLLRKQGNTITAAIRYRIGQQFVETKVESLPVAEFPEIPRFKGDTIALPDSVRDSIHDAIACASTTEPTSTCRRPRPTMWSAPMGGTSSAAIRSPCR